MEEMKGKERSEGEDEEQAEEDDERGAPRC